jgi:hypothetical protein
MLEHVTQKYDQECDGVVTQQEPCSSETDDVLIAIPVDVDTSKDGPQQVCNYICLHRLTSLHITSQSTSTGTKSGARSKPKFCGECGHRNQGTKFCGECGQAMRIG